jgi:hypothetical protein
MRQAVGARPDHLWGPATSASQSMQLNADGSAGCAVRSHDGSGVPIQPAGLSTLTVMAPRDPRKPELIAHDDSDPSA